MRCMRREKYEYMCSKMGAEACVVSCHCTFMCCYPGVLGGCWGSSIPWDLHGVISCPGNVL